MREPLFPMLFPVFCAHVSDAEFRYLDLIWKEPMGIMAYLMGDSGLHLQPLRAYTCTLLGPKTCRLRRQQKGTKKNVEKPAFVLF
jgi:hypothetical protein